MRTIFLIILLINYFDLSGAGSVNVADLRCEYLKDPLGIDTPEPRFSWITESNNRGYIQSAYEILVDKSESPFKTGGGIEWSSGKVASRQSTNISYSGNKLESNTTYFWKVRVWDKEGQVSPWSKVASFHMGLLNKVNWNAKWIGDADIDNRSPLMRREFTLKNKIKKAYAYVSGVGNYELYLNGERVGDNIMDPGPSQHEKRLLYTTYDVSDYLKTGENAAGIWLGEGWGAFSVRDSSRFYQKAKASGPFARPMAILQLDIIYQSGRTERIVTDENWKSSASPLTYNNFFGGEDYDARLEQPGWNKTDFEDSRWQAVQIMDVNSEMNAQMIPPMKVMEIIKAIKQTQPQKNIFVYDFGTVFGGWMRIHVNGKKGTRLKIRGSETLGDSKFPQPLNDKLTLNFSRRCFRNCESNYILKGDGQEVYEPRFYFNGFRYLQIESDQPENINSLEVEGCLVFSSLDETGTFSCSDEMLNRIHGCTIMTFKTIFQGLPAGNTNDEKYAWTGDTHLFYEAASQNFDMAAFWTKWLKDVSDAQSMFKSGVVPNVAPHYHRYLDPNKRREPLRTPTASWGAAYPIVAWAVYLYYHDERILSEHYRGIKRWCDYLTSISRGHLVEGAIGDHNAPGISVQENFLSRGKIPETANLVASAYYFRSVQIMSRISEVLGKKDESREYAALAEKIKSAYIQKFFDREKKIYRDGKPEPGFFPLQAVNLIPLQMGLVQEDYRKAVLDHVIKDIRETHDNHLFTGIIGTKAMVDVLPDNNNSELLYEVVTQQTFPGWGYWLENGATTLWQHWTGHKGDLAHAMWSTIDEFFVEDLSGIKSPINGETSSGYDEIKIKPQIPQKLTFASASIKCIKGTISSSWEMEKNKFTFKVEIPANTTATVHVPVFVDSDFTIKEGMNLIWEKGRFYAGTEGIYSGKKQEDFVEFEIGSGRYHFILE